MSFKDDRLGEAMALKVLDLHGVVYEDVDDMVHRFVNENWKEGLELHVVTGHSTRMKNIVKDILKMYDVEIEDGDMCNPGYLRILT